MMQQCGDIYQIERLFLLLQIIGGISDDKAATVTVQLSREGDVLDLAVLQRVVEKSGAWFSYKGDRLGQGRENSKQSLKDNPQLLRRIENEVKVKLGMPVRQVEEKAESAGGAKAAGADKK